MHVLIECPSVSGEIHFQSLACIFNLQSMLSHAGLTFEFNASVVREAADARNIAATRLASGDGDILVGMDDGMSVDHGAFQAMLSANVPYIAACHPQRSIDLKRLANGVRKGFEHSDALRFAAPLADGPGTAPGVSEVERIGAGVFILRSAPAMALVESGAVALRKAQGPDGEVDAYGFYDYIGDGDGSVSEDYGFCRRLREAGYPVHAYKGPGVSNSGEMTFRS